MNKLYLSSSIKSSLKHSAALAQKLNIGMEISRIPFYKNVNMTANEMGINIKNELKDYNIPLTLHSLFSDLNIASQDEDIVKISGARYKYSFEIAKLIKAKTLLFHSGNKAMKHKESQDKFIDKSIKYWSEFIKYFEDANIVAVIENVHERTPEPCLRIIEGVNSPNFKAALDVGHANLFSEVPITTWIKKYGKQLYHLHIHNNYSNNDDHNSLKNGSVNYKEIIQAIKCQNINPQFVFEMFKEEQLRESLKYFNEINSINV